LAKSKLIREGCLYENRLLEGIIAKEDNEHLFVEVGLKFPVVMKKADVPVPE
jgi:hypothetical protein